MLLRQQSYKPIADTHCICLLTDSDIQHIALARQRVKDSDVFSFEKKKNKMSNL